MPTIASNPENGLSIECHIETQTQYQLGKPITVKGIIRNSGASALWILRWNTFLQPHCGDCLLVTHNGSPVPYIGHRGLHGHPSAESYIRIPAGGSEERQIDISEIYDIREPGEYQVSFCHSLRAAEETDTEAPRDPGRLKLTSIKSEKVTFRIEGSGSGLPITKVESPSPSSQTTLGWDPYPRDPEFITPPEWSDEEKNDWTDAHRAAYRRIVAAANSLYGGMPVGAYRTWFENKENPGWDVRSQRVQGNLQAMATMMKDYNIAYRKSVAKNDIAWSDPGGLDKTIYLHTLYAFDTSQLEMQGGPNKDLLWGRAFNVAHEMSHLAASTKDKSYDWKDCEAFAANDPATAIENAQSYALYVMNTDPSKLPFEPDKVNLKDGDLIYLQANNGKYLGNVWWVSGNNYIQASHVNLDATDCYFKVQKNPSSFYLIINSSGHYLFDAGFYIMLDGTSSPGKGCEFRIGAFTDHTNQKYLVLQSVETDKLWAQCDDKNACIITNHVDIDKWTRFKVEKVK